MRNSTRRILQITLLVSGACCTLWAGATPVDLNTWTQESYPAVGGFPAGHWVVSGDGSSVTQQNNGQPTFFYSDFNSFGTAATGTIKVTGGDDDYIGFALGFLPGDSTDASADYLLVDWKRNDQYFDFAAPSGDPGGTAYAGLAVSRVTGIPTADEFWAHTTYSGGGLTELQRGLNLHNTGWALGVTYEFTFDFGPHDLEVFVDGVKELDITGDFADGRLAFYNFSQAGVTYAAFTVDTGSFSTPEPASLVLMGLGLLGFGVRTRRTSV